MILETMMFAVCVAPADLAQTYVPQEAEAPQAVRVVPLSGFQLGGSMPRAVPLPPFIGGSEDRGFSPSSGLLQFSRQAPASAEVDAIEDLVRERFMDAMDEDLLNVEARRRSLLLWGDAGLVDEAAEFLRVLEGAAASPVAVEAWLLPVEDATASEGASPTFGPGNAPSRYEATWEGRATAGAGQVIGLGDWGATPIVRDVNTEVAQEMSVANPEVADVMEGVRVVLEVHPLAGSSDLVVFGQAAFAERRGPIRSEPTGLSGQPSIDAVDLDSHAATFSARVKDGGGLVIWHAGDSVGGGRRALVVQLRRGSPPAAAVGESEVLPVGALTRVGMDERVVGVVDRETGDEGLLFGEGEAKWRAPVDRDEVEQLVRAVLGDALDEEEASVSILGEALVVRADAAGRGRVRELIARLEDDLLVGVGVVLRTVAGERTIHELAFPALLGRPHLALRGVETTGVGGMHSEIAQGAAVLSPDVDLRFGGLIASVVPMPGLDGVFVDAQVDLTIRDPAVRRPLEGDQGGLLSMSTARYARFVQRGAVERGTVIDLGDGPVIDGVRTRQTLEIR